MSTPAENHGSAFIFHPDTARFERIEDSKLQHLETACLSLQDGRILLFGNPQFSERGITRMEVYHPESRQFEVLPIVLPGMRLLGKAVELPNNRVLYIGGVQGDIKPVKPFTFSNVTIEADIIDLNPNRQSVKIVKTNALRLANSVTRLLDGRILIAGGSGDRTAEIFDPTNDTFVPTQGFLDHPRGEHTATLLKDGRVLLTGGIDFREGYAKFDNSMEIYDPKADRFYLLKEAMRYPRASHTAQILDNGKVLLIGGKQDFGKSCENCLSNGEIFDPNTMTIDDIAGHMSAKRALVNVIPGNDHLFYVLGVVDTSNTDALDIVVYQELIPKTHMANAEK